MKNIYAAVTRKNLAGTKEYLPEEGLDIDTAIRLFTQMGAYPSFDENKKGTLETENTLISSYWKKISTPQKKNI